MKALATSFIVLACAAVAPNEASAARPQDVLRSLHGLNQMIVKAASLAQRRAGRNDVRAFARRLEMDHRFAAHRLLEISEKLDLPLAPKEEPRAPAAKERFADRLAELEAMRGPDFDDAFIQLMREANLHAIDLLSSAERDLPPALVRSLDRLIPIYEQHVALAIHLAGASGARAEAKR